MIISIFLLLFIIIIILFVAGFSYSGELKYGAQVFHIVSSCLLIILGVIILSDGIEFKNGSSLVTSGNTTIISYSYESLSGGFSSYGLSYTFFFLGFMLGLYTFLIIKYKRQSRGEYSEEDE